MATMSNIEEVLGSAIKDLSEENYERSFAQYRLLFEIGQTYFQIPPDLIFDTIWKQISNRQLPSHESRTIIYPTSPLFLRFANDAESDIVLAPHSAGLRSRLCTSILREFFDHGLEVLYRGQDAKGGCLLDANLIAHGVNLGYIEETAIRSHILQFLAATSHPTKFPYREFMLCILFKIAGATFEAYTDPSVIDRCFELLKGYDCGNYAALKPFKDEVIQLRERGWEGLPPPPVFATRGSGQTGTSQEGLIATPIPTSLGLPSLDLKPQIPLSPPLESVITPEIEMISGSPITQSSSISISSLSNFTVTETPDDELPTDPKTITPHGTFSFEDGNVEVLCGNTLFRVHTSVLSLKFPVFRQTFAQANLAAAESPNGCPRIPSSDTATDFATLLKIIYLPGFPEQNKVPDFNTFSSLLRITAKYEMPTVRPQLIEVIRDGYPETFEGLMPTKSLGENVFSGRTPHPNEVLNLFVQQGLTSALPMAYYMAARRGIDSLVNKSLPRSATLSPEILQSALKGLMALRELELNETYRLVLGSRTSHPCPPSNCPSSNTTGPRVSDAHKKIIDRIADPSRSGTKVLQVLSLSRTHEGSSDGFCESCVKGWEAGHVEVRKRAWNTLLDAFGLRG